MSSGGVGRSPGGRALDICGRLPKLRGMGHSADAVAVPDEGRLLAARLCADPRPDVVAAALARETARDVDWSRTTPGRDRLPAGSTS
jgi:hypothetical protein